MLAAVPNQNKSVKYRQMSSQRRTDIRVKKKNFRRYFWVLCVWRCVHLDCWSPNIAIMFLKEMVSRCFVPIFTTSENIPNLALTLSLVSDSFRLQATFRRLLSGRLASPVNPLPACVTDSKGSITGTLRIGTRKDQTWESGIFFSKESDCQLITGWGTRNDLNFEAKETVPDSNYSLKH